MQGKKFHGFREGVESLFVNSPGIRSSKLMVINEPGEIEINA